MDQGKNGLKMDNKGVFASFCKEEASKRGIEFDCRINTIEVIKQLRFSIVLSLSL